MAEVDNSGLNPDKTRNDADPLSVDGDGDRAFRDRADQLEPVLVDYGQFSTPRSNARQKTEDSREVVLPSERIVYLVDGVLPLIEDWLAIWNPVQDELFPAFLPHGDEPIPGESFSDQAIYKTVRKRALLAGVEVSSPHGFRHSFVTNSLRVSDVFIVARQVGHRQVETTRQYDDRPESEQAEAARRWSIAKTFN